MFHLAYAMLMPALYVPILLMLTALIFRGIAFEFRFKAERAKRLWDYSFHYGSLVATFMQGVVLGTFVQGFKVSGRSFAGGTWDWLTPFSIMTGLGLVLGYGLLGLPRFRYPRFLPPCRPPVPWAVASCLPSCEKARPGTAVSFFGTGTPLCSSFHLPGSTAAFRWSAFSAPNSSVAAFVCL